MCGRYSAWELELLGEQFNLYGADIAKTKELNKSYNISPTQIEPTIIRESGKNRLEMARWGFIAPWMKDYKETYKYSSFNARSEDIFKKPMWRTAIKKTRCIVPANGFYEWKHVGKEKLPYFIKPLDQDLFGFGGIYGNWTDAGGKNWLTFAIVTTQANEQMLDIHHRMPIILNKDEYDVWLDPENQDEDMLDDIMKPYRKPLDIYRVGSQVNSGRVDDRTLVIPLG